MRGLSLELGYDDDDMIELVVSVDAGAFRGTTRCYAMREHLARLSRDLAELLRTLTGTAVLELGLDDGTRAARIEVYAVGGARHPKARVRLVGEGARDGGPAPSVEVELPLEAAAIDEFAQALMSVERVGDVAYLRSA